VETDPANILALTSLASAYLRLNPPEAEKALLHLNRALQIGEASQGNIADDRRLDLTNVYVGLGDGYLTQANEITADKPNVNGWQQKKGAYTNAVKYLEMASRTPSGFAPSDARAFSRLSEACEGQALMDSQELAAGAGQSRDVLLRERDALRSASEAAMRRAREILVAGNVSPMDSFYRGIILGQGSMFFGREVGASDEEKTGYYRQALVRYQEAAALFPDDPRPWLYQGLCYERLTGLAASPEEKRRQFALGEEALRKAATLSVASPDYSPALPYRALASLYGHMNDFRSALGALKQAQQADPAGAQSSGLDREIQNLERFLATKEKGP
jgi:hypothetical protein